VSVVASMDRPVRPAARQRAAKMPGGAGLGKEASREAKRQAAGILEVLAGLRTPAQAAAALQVSQARYYLLEQRALEGMLKACEPRPKGRQRSASDLPRLRAENARLQREVARQQALVRLAQRSVGLAPPAPAPAKPGKKSRKRRPVARALSVASRLQQDVDPVPAIVPPGIEVTVS
jgi:hypothetical protein